MRDMGPQKISVVEEAQRKIVALVRRLVEANEIGRPSRGAQP
jgi:flagellar motor switch protein FliG